MQNEFMLCIFVSYNVLIVSHDICIGGFMVPIPVRPLSLTDYYNVSLCVMLSVSTR